MTTIPDTRTCRQCGLTAGYPAHGAHPIGVFGDIVIHTSLCIDWRACKLRVGVVCFVCLCEQQAGSFAVPMRATKARTMGRTCDFYLCAAHADAELYY